MNRKRGVLSRCNLFRVLFKSKALNHPLSRSLFADSRGQLTIFIIVGIIVLFTFAGIMLVTRNTAETRISASGEPVITAAPQEFQGIQAFTETCLMDQGKKALVILGKQGGYINPTTMGEFSETDPTDSLGLDLGSLQIPYWQYNPEKNEKEVVSLSSLRPLLYYEDDPSMSVEAQLARQVQAEIKGCLDNYDNFKTEGFILTMSEPEVEVSISDVAVNFWLKMDVEADKAGSKHKFEQFYVSVLLELKRYYEVASLITEAEQNYTFLETQALELISIYSGVDSKKLPPTSAMEFEFVPTTFWSTAAVKDDLQNVLVSNVALLRYLSSDNFYRYEYPDYASTNLGPLIQKTYDNNILALDDGEGLNINFDYFDWPLYFNVNSDGAVIKPQSLFRNYDFFNFGVQNYNTVYDLSYPVLVTIQDEDAFDGGGYIFSFALETNLRNNAPVMAESQKDGDEEEGNDLATLRKTRKTFSGSQGNLACDKNQMDTELIKTIVVDSSSNDQVLEGVQVGYSIPNQNDCLIGMTDNQGIVEDTYPLAYGGAVSFIKDGYLPVFYPLDTYEYQSQPVSQGQPASGSALGSALIGYAVKENLPDEKKIQMHKYKDINVGVKKINLQKSVDGKMLGNPFGSFGEKLYSYDVEYEEPVTHAWHLGGRTVPLKDTEKVMLTLTRVRDIYDQVYNSDLVASIALNGQEQKEVRLVPGVYEVSATLLLEEAVIFPEEERCFGSFIGENCLTIDRTMVESFLSGSLEWDTEESYLVIEEDQLYGANMIEFYVPAADILSVPQEPGQRVIEDLEVSGKIQGLSKEVLRGKLEPRFK